MDCEDILAVLEFYADLENYTKDTRINDGFSVPEIVIDRGEKAREILKKIYQEE